MWSMNEGTGLSKGHAMLTDIKPYLGKSFVLFCFIGYKFNEMMPGAWKMHNKYLLNKEQ